MAPPTKSVYDLFQDALRRRQGELVHPGPLVAGEDGVMVRFALECDGTVVQRAEYQCTTCVTLVAVCESLKERVESVPVDVIGRWQVSDVLGWVVGIPESHWSRVDVALRALQACPRSVQGNGALAPGIDSGTIIPSSADTRRFQMARVESHAPGSFCWAELATTDPVSAKQFYSEMFGWTVHDNPMPEGVYTIFRVEGNDAAAMYNAPPGVRSYWGVYFSVVSVDTSAARITELGGKIVAGPFDVMEFGRMVVGQDAQGAMFSVWQPKLHIGATHGGPLNAVGWPELRTPDPQSAANFYSGLFGWKTKPDDGIGEAQYVEWYNGAQPVGGLFPMRGAEWTGVPPHWMIYVTVADCDERTAKAKQLGAEICVQPMDIPNVGRFAVLRDPQGAAFSLIQLNVH